MLDPSYREARKAKMDAWQLRVACETLATTNRIVIAGEVRSTLDSPNPLQGALRRAAP